MKSLVFALSIACAFGLQAKTVYVNCNFDDYTGHDGSTPELALKTLVEATGYTSSYPHAAGDGDTVMVAEGVYKEGSSNPTTWWGDTRIHIEGKKLYIKASGRAEYTIIEGQFSSDTSYGYGAGAVRCITVQGAKAAESVIEGFTLRKGSTAAVNSANIPTCGGAVCSSSTGYVSQEGPYLVGCIIENCSSPRCGIAWGGTFVRCLIRHNVVEAGKYFCWNSTFVNSIITRNVADNGTSYGTAHFDQSKAINCTIADNYCNLYPTTTSYVYNNLVSGLAIPVGGADGYYAGNYNDSTTARVLMGPALGDCRLRDGCAETVKTADASYLGVVTLPSGEAPWNVDPYVDYFGNAIPKEGTICAGCSQGAGAGVGTPICGAVILKAGVQLGEGGLLGAVADTYFYSPDYPATYRVRPRLATGKRVYNYKYTYNAVATKIFPLPGDDDPTDVIPPPLAEKALTIEPYIIANIKWVDPKLDDYTVADGTEDHPYKTIQEAITAGLAGKTKDLVVLCKSGTYGDNQGVLDFDWNNTNGKTRFEVPSSTSVRFVAVDGPDETFLVGKADPGTATGCGKDAVDIMSMKGLAAVQGFTVTGSYASTDGNGGYYSTGRGGTHYSYGVDCYFTDCILSNNVGSYAALGCSQYFRCRILNNTGAECIVGDAAKLFSCVVAGNVVTGSNKTHLKTGNDYPIFHCSCVGNATSYIFPNATGGIRVNCAADDGGYSTFAVGGNWGCVYWGFKEYLGENYLKANPMFVDKTAGDLRLAKASAGVTAAVAPGDANANDWWLYCTSDVNGDPLAFDAEGRPLPGAYASAADGVYIDAAKGGIAVAGGKIGFNELAPGETVTVSAAAGTRPCAGLLVGGVTNLFEEAPGHAFAFTPESGNVAVEAFYTTEWYAAVDGDDAATGFYPSAAKTLKGALTNPDLASGDTVLACAGTYAPDDTMMQDGGTYIRSRAVVPANVTLASKDGRDVTFIKGASATVEDPEFTGHGLGADAIRCVTLLSGARLKGFTLVDGRTRAVLGDEGDKDRHAGCETTGGGVGAFKTARNACWVEDCVISNCAAYRGGGDMAVRAKNCIFRNNYACYIGGGTSDTQVYGCLSAGNTVDGYAQSSIGFGYTPYAENCTACDGIGYANASSEFRNCLVTGKFVVNGVVDPTKVSHCLFNSALATGVTAEWLAATDGTVKSVGLDRIATDADGRPVIGSNLAVDAADPAINAETYAADASQGQRVYNGAMDIGALEGDWRPVYAKDIRKSQLTVEAASPTVKEADGVVTLNGESSLTAVWANPRQREGRKLVQMNVTGNGTLYVKLNGETVKEVTSETEDPTFTFDNTLAENTLAFDYVPGEGDTGHAEILGAKSLNGFLLFVR